MRASRAGLVSLRVQTRVAKNTQVALQNGRFVLRGRYGSVAEPGKRKRPVSTV